MSKSNFFLRIWLSFVGVLFVFGVGVAFTLIHTLRGLSREEVAEQLRLASLGLGDTVVSVLEKEGPEALNRWVGQAGRRMNIRITVISADETGQVFADSEHDPKIMENHSQRLEVMSAMENGLGESVRFSETTRSDRLYVAVRYPLGGQGRYIIRASRNLTALDRLTDQFILSFLLASGLALLGSLGLSFLITRRLTRPLTDLTEAARRLSRGELSTRVLPRETSEFLALSTAFNQMAEEVQKLVGELTARNEEWTVVLATIREGLALIAPDFTVVRANAAFGAIAGTPEVQGRPYWELITPPRFGDLLKSVHQTGKPLTEAVAIRDREYLCSMSPLTGRAMTVTLLLDITELRRLEAVKRDLVVNFSHEFKTPLTAIQGYAEAMEIAPAPNREYAAIIRRNAARLAQITDELLLLANLERKDRELTREPVDLPALLRQMEELFQPMLSEKGLTLKTEVAPGFPVLPADRFLLEQVFTNLLSNAIRHTEKGGITIQATRVARRVVIEVTDTGEGIPPEHLERIFERFYVVEKSRSRRRNGTGLGLSIVRNIVLRHGGEVSVNSQVERGTTFHLCFPLTDPEDYDDPRE